MKLAAASTKRAESGTGASNTSPGIAASLAASSICGARDEGLCSLGAAADGKMRVALPRASAGAMM